MTNDELLDTIYAARDRYAASVGTVDPDVLAPVINPSFMGGPSWPNLRQAWRVIRRESTTVIMSDGLADPFMDEPDLNAGLGLEVLAETADPLSSEPWQESWLLRLVYDVSQQCAHHGEVRSVIDRLGVICLELPITAALERFATDRDTAGVLLGITPPDFPSHFDVACGSVSIVTAKLLWPTEVDYAAEHRAEGRAELVRRFAADGTYHRSSLLRPSVV